MPESTLTVLWPGQEPNVFECGAFRRPRARRAGNLRDRFATYAVWLGTVDDWEELARAILADVEAIRTAAPAGEVAS